MNPARAFELADATVNTAAATLEGREHLDWFFGSAARTNAGDAEDNLSVQIIDDGFARPARAPDSTNGPVERWDEPDQTIVWHESGRGAEVRSDQITIGPPAHGDTDSWRSARQLLAEGLAAWFGWRGEAVVHGAHVGSGTAGLVLVGPTGSGKSTLAAAALTTGWNLHGDDLVIVRHQLDAITAHGIPKRPSFDQAIAGDMHIPLAPNVDDPRARMTMSSDQMTSGWTTVRAIVVVDHDPGDGTVGRLEHADVLHELVASTFDATRRAGLINHLATLATMADLPGYRIGLASSPGDRIDQAGRALKWIWTDAERNAG